MTTIQAMNPAQLAARHQALKMQFETIQSKQWQLDMTRGKPCTAQLELSNPLLSIADANACVSGVDVRNYGGLEGIASLRSLVAQVLDTHPENVIIGGNSSLNLMYDTVVRAMLFGVCGGQSLWSESDISFLCPVPGYDRHFSICESLGIRMIPVQMTGAGPDMDQVEALVAQDENIKGIWCVPKYSNPTGETYSEEVVKRLASMPTAAQDFRVFWDNAYVVHTLEDQVDDLPNMLNLCEKAGHADRVFMYTSTSKVTFAGGGVSAFAASKDNVAWMLKHMSMQTIGSDKVNQLRHVLFLKNQKNLAAHMQKHARILKPKFERVLSILEQMLGGLDIAHWTLPKGGYFISLDVEPGLAQKVVALASELGVKLTPAGATYPYGQDPEDKNIRIAPSFPSVEDIEDAMQALVLCIELASIEKRLAQ